MILTTEDVKKRIIFRMVNWNKWGGSHTENLLGGIPSHYKGHKITKQAVKELIKGSGLLAAIKTNEVHYALNPEKTKEILEFYEKYCKG